jgi:hypothetical protein
MKILDPKVGPTVAYNVIDRRFKEIQGMIKKHSTIDPVLVFGERAPFEVELSRIYNIDFTYTNWDLNYQFPIITEKYNTMFCCEVIEHLLNPLWFFQQARELMTEDTLMYLTYPIQPHWAWCACHFHEYDKSRFLYLLREAGLDIADYKELIMWKRITGIRPIIRNTPFGRLKIQLYVLKKGKLRCDME